MDLGRAVRFDRVVLQEAITQGQTIASYRVLAGAGEGWQEVCAGQTIGHQRIAAFPPLTASRLRVELTTTGAPATLRKLGLYRGRE